ncbi:hypothetical protein BDM02DRAFT_3074580, partial [Thelephora ganbajun]
CKTGGFYKTPTMNQNITTGEKFDIEWDSTCLNANAVDIYLYMPGADNTRIHMWQNVNFALGKYTGTLHSSWWNSTQATVKLQVKIVPNGSPPFLSDFPAAPIFTATKGSKDNGKATAGIEIVNNFGQQPSSTSRGKVAAGVLVPLLFIIGASIYAWIRYRRNKGKEDRKRWSEAVDKRMSTISTDWKSISAAGASAAIRNSMAVSGGGNRNSSFSFGPIRPVSTFGENQAGIGTQGSGEDSPQMSQLRPGLRASAVGVNRVSRVSFAIDTRPSGESRRATRALHTGHVPPLPTRQDSSELSPTQTAGPLPLTADDIRKQMSGQARPSMDDYMPALSMMCEGGNNGSQLLLSSPKDEMPAPLPAALPKSPMSGMMPMQPMPANVMSPDDMLRAYAESRRAPASPAFPSPVLTNYDGNGMRTLYTPTTPSSTTPTSEVRNLHRKSTVVSMTSKYDDEDAYVGTA